MKLRELDGYNPTPMKELINACVSEQLPVKIKRVCKRNYSPRRIEMHLLIEMIYRARCYFKLKQYAISELNMHIPLSLRDVLVLSLDGNGAKKWAGEVFIFDMLCVPAYENRIVISHPAYAIYENEPMVIIELEIGNNYPTYKEIN